jgi:hypothetical protein
MKHLRVLFFSCLWLSACTLNKTGIVDSNVILGPGESLFMLGISPRHAQTQILTAHVKDGIIEQRISNVWVFARPTDGFVIWKGDTDKKYKLGGVTLLDDEDRVWGSMRKCGDISVPVFGSGGAKVVYLGDIRFNKMGDGFEETYHDHYLAARAYLDQKIPSLRGQLVQGTMEKAEETTPCAVPMVIPIPVIRGR